MIVGVREVVYEMSSTMVSVAVELCLSLTQKWQCTYVRSVLS